MSRTLLPAVLQVLALPQKPRLQPLQGLPTLQGLLTLRRLPWQLFRP
jgi:hypothetical protein